MRAHSVVAIVGLLLAGCDLTGECGEPAFMPVENGTYQLESTSGDPADGFPHPGAVGELEVDREAGLVRVRGTTDDGRPFVETWRIRAARR